MFSLVSVPSFFSSSLYALQATSQPNSIHAVTLPPKIKPKCKQVARGANAGKADVQKRNAGRMTIWSCAAAHWVVGSAADLNESVRRRQFQASHLALNCVQAGQQGRPLNSVKPCTRLATWTST
jgi:hypothetical protein